jgi:ATP-dependent Lhr-like helicase
MDRLTGWFRDNGWSPFDFQVEAWRAYARGESGLIHAPTGMGKTMAAFGGPLIEWLEEEGADELGDEGTEGTRRHVMEHRRPREGGDPASLDSRLHGEEVPATLILWLTPMRALANDTAESLRRPLRDLKIPWTVGIRTGDTTPTERAKQKRKPPTLLITTPESLSVMLSYAGASEQWKYLRSIIVDEWHELLASKRGVQAELCLARLRRIAPRVRTWGLSATLGNLEEAMHALVPPTPRHIAETPAPRSPRLIRGILPKAIDVETITPPPDEIDRFPWSGHLGTRLLPDVIRRIERARTTLLFTNTRSQAELWFQAIWKSAPPWADKMAMHHGSIDHAVRVRVEEMLRAGALKCAVCTSSLDLGVDFSPVDQVIQVGSPKGVARMLQRAGRSGHQPGAVSRIVGVPTNALELMEFAAARDAVNARRVESRPPIKLALDVLAQHVVTLSAGDGFVENELLEEVRSTHSFATMTDEQWQWVMDFVRQGGRALRAYPRFARVVRAAERHVVASPRIARLHRLSIGTIVSDTAMSIRLVRGRQLGSIEESFIARLVPGDRFVFGGRILELVRVRDMTAFVKPSNRRAGIVPRWMGGRSPLSTELAETIREKLEQAREGRFDSKEMRLIRPLLELQARWSRLPGPDDLLIELTIERGVHHAFIFTLAGRLANEGLGALIAHRIARGRPSSIGINANDYGFALSSRSRLPRDEMSWRPLLSAEELVEDLLVCVNGSELARRRFREIARIAGLIFAGYPGQPKPMRHLQASSELYYEVFRGFDPENLLLHQAQREVLDSELEVARLREALERASTRSIRIVETERFTPLAFPLWVDRIRAQQLSTERWMDRVARMAARLEQAATESSPPGERRPRRERALAQVGV